MPPLSVFSTRAAMMAAAATAIVEALRFGLATRGAACAALSGGSTPAPAYGLVDRAALEWSKITLALVDERFVPPTEAVSNEKLARESFTAALSAGAKFAPMYSGGTAPESAVRANELYKALQIDIAVMGMGGDGHTASWFPLAPNLPTLLDLTNPNTVASMHSSDAQPTNDRLTLTRAALTRADRLLLLITGREKRARLEGGGAPVHALFAPEMPPCDILYAD